MSAVTLNAIAIRNYIVENNIEYRWQDNDGARDVLIFPYTFQIHEFSKLLPPTLFDDGLGVVMYLRDSYVCIFMAEILEYLNIELDEIFGSDPGL